MRIFSLLCVSLLIITSCTENTNGKGSREDSIKRAQTLDAVMDTNNVASIQWIDSVDQQLGEVPEGAQVEVTWRFTNTGTKNLVIGNVNAGCGCTTPETPKEPIPPGGEGKIKAVFDSNGRPGTQKKEVFVLANTKPPNTTLSFSVEVKKK